MADYPDDETKAGVLNSTQYVTPESTGQKGTKHTVIFKDSDTFLDPAIVNPNIT